MPLAPAMRVRAAAGVARVLDAVEALAAWLVLPLSAALFLQWPLRELVQAYSREVNDAAQLLFALYVGVAITAATRAHAHLVADVYAERLPARWRAHLERIAAGSVLVPWSLYVIWTGVPVAWRSVVALESFGETYTPGYFLVKIAVVLMAALVLLQALAAAILPATAGLPVKKMPE
jgi:TRAP-type mannitol/chloroaromatic compound transport system permease small subunit